MGREFKAHLRKIEGSGLVVQTEQSAWPDPEGEILIMLALGRAPYKTPMRIQIGPAMDYAGRWVTGNPGFLTNNMKYGSSYLAESGRHGQFRCTSLREVMALSSLRNHGKITRGFSNQLDAHIGLVIYKR